MSYERALRLLLGDKVRIKLRSQLVEAIVINLLHDKVCKVVYISIHHDGEDYISIPHHRFQKEEKNAQ